MAIKDPHDTRPFRQYVTLDAKGNVIATHEVAAGAEVTDGRIEVTDLYPADFRNVKVDTKLAASVKTQITEQVEQSLSIQIEPKDML